MPTPKFPRYKKNSLRPNPATADPTKGTLAFAQETARVGHFGNWHASGRVVTPEPSETRATPGGLGQFPNEPERVKPSRNIRPPKK